MFKTIEEFLINWGHESGSTQKILDTLTDKSLGQEVSPEDRTLGRIAWHIVTTLHEMMSRTGLEFEARPHDAPVPEHRQLKLRKRTVQQMQQWFLQSKNSGLMNRYLS